MPRMMMPMDMDMGGMKMKGPMDMNGKPKSPAKTKSEPMDTAPQNRMDMGGMDMGGVDMHPAIPASNDVQQDRSWDATALPQILDQEINFLTGAPYTLPQLQALATKNNPTLIQAHAQVEGERGKALQAGLWRNPDMAYSGQLMGVRNAGMGEFQGGMLQQEVVLGGKLKYSRKKYQARQTAAEQQEKAQKLRVMNDVTVEFYKTLAAMHKVIVHQDFVNSAQDSWVTRREMLNTGEASHADIQHVNAELERAKLRLMAAQNDLQFHWQQLTCLVGIEADLAPLDGQLEDDANVSNWSRLLHDTIDGSPELGEAKAKLHSDEITVSRELRQRVPNLLLCAGPGYDQIDKSMTAVATASLTNLPVFNRNQGTIIQARADLARQHAQVKLVELQLRSKLAEQFRTYTTAKQHVDGYRKTIVPAAVKRYQLLLQSYQNVRTDWPAVLDAQRDMLSAKLTYIDHLAELKKAETELRGFVLTGGLVAPPGVTPPGHIDATPNPR